MITQGGLKIDPWRRPGRLIAGKATATNSLQAKMNPYEEWYGIPLIDDIHNYFPDILYNPDSFTSVRDLTRYISQGVRRRFSPDLINAASIAAAGPHSLVRQSGSGQSGSGQSNLHSPVPQILAYTIPLEPSPAVQETIQNFNTSQTELFRLVDFTLNLFGTNRAPTLTSVPVVPTPAQIDEGTHVVIVSDITVNNNCAICVEPIEVGNECRQINHCHHLFHKECIDTHFQTSVRCPLCRHDIRDSIDSEFDM